MSNEPILVLYPIPILYPNAYLSKTASNCQMSLKYYQPFVVVTDHCCPGRPGYHRHCLRAVPGLRRRPLPQRLRGLLRGLRRALRLRSRTLRRLRTRTLRLLRLIFFLFSQVAVSRPPS